MNSLRWADLSIDEQDALQGLREQPAPLLSVNMADQLKGKGLAEAGVGGTDLSNSGRALLDHRTAALMNAKRRRDEN